LAEAFSVVRDIVIIVMGIGVVVVTLFAASHLRGLFAVMQEMKRELGGITRSLETQSERLGDTLLSLRALTDAVRVTHDDRIEPILRNLEYATKDLNDSLRTINTVVQKGGKFSLDTIRQATVYRDRVFRPVLEAASLLSGARAVLRGLPVPKPKFLRRK
jgi:hypothetical protein